jgi:hypothetical protein
MSKDSLRPLGESSISIILLLAMKKMTLASGSELVTEYSLDVQLWTPIKRSIRFSQNKEQLSAR